MELHPLHPERDQLDLAVVHHNRLCMEQSFAVAFGPRDATGEISRGTVTSGMSLIVNLASYAFLTYC